jgi:glycosyltransferase involved in cell wall biosynthesis
MMDKVNKKILVITEVFSPEDFLINDLVFHWKQQGRDVSVLTRNPSYPEGKIYKGYENKLFQKEIINDVPVSRVQFIPGYKNNSFIKVLNYLWNMLLGILWAIKNGKTFDSIYIYQTGPLTFSTAGIIIKKLYHKKVTIWTQDIWPDTVHAYGWAKKGISRKILDSFVKWIYRNCDNVTVSSPGFESIIRQYYPSKIIQFIPQWSFTAKLNGNDTSPIVKFPGTFNFVFAGNIGKVQNLENVISGFELFQKENPKKGIWLNLIGDGSNLSYLQENVKTNKIENVKFWGRMKSTEMPGLYDKTDVLIIALENQPIFNLTIPAKFQSYLNADKPIFGIINGEVANLIVKYNLGWIASPDCIPDIADIFKEIVSCKPEILVGKIQNTNSLLEEQFNREKIMQKFTDMVFN